MKPYDAKESQECNICGFQISHNKQGRFTSHMKNEHGLTLDEYLIKHHYKPGDLKCSNELCEGEVKLTRGKPNSYCCPSCRQRKSRLRACEVCSTEFDNEDLRVKTCSKDCKKLLKSNSAKLWHEAMSAEEKEKHFKKIITKTAKTRRENKTLSWNSGKTDVYSEETIEKIRQATLKQMENQVFQKTRIERVIEEHLQELGVEYRYSFILKKRQYDFVLPNQNLIIECDGDYWHANPKFYPEPADWQIERIQIDQEKNEIARSNGYQMVRFWEDDILNNFEYVKSIIHDLLATT